MTLQQKLKALRHGLSAIEVASNDPASRECAKACREWVDELPADIQDAVEAEREACLDDIEGAIGNWGGSERAAFDRALTLCVREIQERAAGIT